MGMDDRPKGQNPAPRAASPSGNPADDTGEFTIDPAFVEDPLTGGTAGGPQRRWLHLRRDGWDEQPLKEK